MSEVQQQQEFLSVKQQEDQTQQYLNTEQSETQQNNNENQSQDQQQDNDKNDENKNLDDSMSSFRMSLKNDQDAASLPDSNILSDGLMERQFEQCQKEIERESMQNQALIEAYQNEVRNSQQKNQLLTEQFNAVRQELNDIKIQSQSVSINSNYQNNISGIQYQNRKQGASKSYTPSEEEDLLQFLNEQKVKKNLVFDEEIMEENKEDTNYFKSQQVSNKNKQALQHRNIFLSDFSDDEDCNKSKNSKNSKIRVLKRLNSTQSQGDKQYEEEKAYYRSSQRKSLNEQIKRYTEDKKFQEQLQEIAVRDEEKLKKRDENCFCQIF